MNLREANEAFYRANHDIRDAEGKLQDALYEVNTVISKCSHLAASAAAATAAVRLRAAIEQYFNKIEMIEED